MPRVFETKLNYLQSIERKFINGDILTVQYIFDEKMPSGAWLENMEFNNELTKAEALVLMIEGDI